MKTQNNMSQFNIDNYVLKYFGNIQGVFLETGSSHPIDQNNTFLLEQKGWSGILIEPRTDCNYFYEIFRPNSILENYALVDKNFNQPYINAYLHDSGHMSNIGGIFEGTQIKWPAITLDKILKKYQIKNIDFFSLDVEGYEHEVLDGIDFDYTSFKMMIIETHDYSWNNRTDDFSYLEKYNYYLKEKITPNHQVWINKNL